MTLNGDVWKEGKPPPVCNYILSSGAVNSTKTLKDLSARTLLCGFQDF